jgi:hypothetical protein
VIKVVRGNPTPEELAAALAVVRAAAAAASASESAWPGAYGAGGPQAPGAVDGKDAWADPARVARTRVPAPGPRAWGRTFWPG